MALHLARPITQPDNHPPGTSPGQQPPVPPHRPATLAAHRHAVERAIHAMQDRLAEPLSLRALAEVAMLSPFHFNRVFCTLTGIPPCKFLTALRIDAAKRLLLTTSLTVTDICLDVGYHSLGSFTRDFTQYVGLPPSRFRRLAEHLTPAHLTRLLDRAAHQPPRPPSPRLTGTITASPAWPGPIFLGLFPTPIPHGRPLACSVLRASGAYALPLSSSTAGHLLAIALPHAADPLTYLLPEPRTLLLGAAPVPIDANLHSIDIPLRPASLTDPPVLVALLHLLVEHYPEVNDAAPRRRSPRLP